MVCLSLLWCGVVMAWQHSMAMMVVVRAMLYIAAVAAVVAAIIITTSVIMCCPHVHNRVLAADYYSQQNIVRQEHNMTRNATPTTTADCSMMKRLFRFRALGKNQREVLIE